ncbi:hypothetical protein [Kitasatospora cathayae]|uniref:DUF3040 domain-containing protein n=1 Tax=Kitasatospora cathayae TaxID=3004092 RepID=A0ABY7QA19_9ACTN|nr:hypothetical protein [Kitasatospora sp. HUAS 3-15]WBP89515.1 hypothetical protein O1G21_29190 [Kitasatospora sp. HUAS 3-15]
MTPPPPPPTQPPTVGVPNTEPEWWRKNGPWSPSTSKPKPKPVNLKKANATSTTDKAVEDNNQEEPDTETSGEGDAQRIWISEFADALAERLGTRIGTILTETPDERAERERAEHEAKYEAKGETEQQRRRRHRREAIARRQKASVLWRQDSDERTKRFRRWCILTAASAAAGYLLHLPQALTHLPLSVGVGAVAVSWLFDHKMRGGGHVRVTQVRGPAVLYLCLVRVPLASALFAVLGLTPLFALTTH